MRTVGPVVLVAWCSVVLACTPYTGPGASAGAAPARKAAAAPPTCASAVDVEDLLARHETSFGREAALVASLPVAWRGTISLEGKRGPHVFVLAKRAHVDEAYIGGLAFASGQDDRGAWSVGGPQGVQERLAGPEATDVAFDAFIARRAYVTAMRAADVRTTCSEDEHAVRVEVSFARPDVGFPTLTFDLGTGALVEATHTSPDGSVPRTVFDGWTDADEAGIRWPKQVKTEVAGTSATVVENDRFSHGDTCTRLRSGGVEAEARDAACLEIAAAHANVTWPAEGLARIPMHLVAGELLVEAHVGGRRVNALFDSGAGITVVDATMPSSSAFVPTMEIEGRGATQKLRLGVGELSRVELGDLRIEALPAASVPIPALASLGDARPEIVLGYTLFALGAVRVDYAKREIVVARRGEDVVGRGARAVPFHVLGGKLVAAADVEGKPAAIVLDTGNGGALDLFARWATPAGIPGKRKKASLRGLFGAGTQESEDVFFRLQHAAIGPLTIDDVLAQVSDQPGGSAIAGLAGNTLFARCDAIVLDHARRTLWLEGACDRPVPAARFGWRLVPNDSKGEAPRWGIGALLPGGAADIAGLRAGDLLVEMDGQPVKGDLARVWTTEDGPEGRTVQITVLRGNARLTRTVTLRAPFR